MRIRQLDHIQLAMPGGGEHLARAFYQDALGLAEIPKPPHLAKRGGCWFAGDDVRIHLGVETDFRPARKAHPALLVEDLNALAERLRSLGYFLHKADTFEGYRRIYVDDPFGNRIELMEPLAP